MRPSPEGPGPPFCHQFNSLLEPSGSDRGSRDVLFSRTFPNTFWGDFGEQNGLGEFSRRGGVEFAPPRRGEEEREEEVLRCLMTPRGRHLCHWVPCASQKTRLLGERSSPQLGLRPCWGRDSLVSSSSFPPPPLLCPPSPPPPTG